MLVFMEKLRGTYEADPLAFVVYVRHVASVIEDQRREEAKTDPGQTGTLTSVVAGHRFSVPMEMLSPRSARQRTAPRGATSRVATPRL
jgi:hypothetical protein